MRAVVQYDVEVRNVCKKTLEYFDQIKKKKTNLLRNHKKKQVYDAEPDDETTNYYFDLDPKLIAGIYFPNCPDNNLLVVSPNDYPIGEYDLCFPFPKPQGECLSDGEIFKSENKKDNNDKNDTVKRTKNNENYKNLKNSTTAISFLQHKSRAKYENPVIMLYRKQFMVNKQINLV